MLNKKTNIAIKLIAIVIAFLVCSQSFIFATSISEKRARIEEIKAQTDALDYQISIIDEEYLQASIKLNKIEDKVEKTTVKLNLARKNLKKNKNLLNNRAKGIYKNGDSTFLDILLSTKSFNEFIESLDFLLYIGTRDAQLVRKVKKAEKILTKAQTELNSASNEQKNTVDQIHSKKSSIENKLAKKKDLISGIEADIEKFEKQQRSTEIKQFQSQNVPIDNGGAPTNAPKSGVVSVAYAQLGKPYSWGAAGPNSFDCSGLTKYCYAQVGVSLPHSSTAQRNSGQSVSQSNLQPGDLVFFGSPIHHVGLYIGGGMMIHAPQSGDVVKVSSVFSRSDYAGASRP